MGILHAMDTLTSVLRCSCCWKEAWSSPCKPQAYNRFCFIAFNSFWSSFWSPLQLCFLLFPLLYPLYVLFYLPFFHFFFLFLYSSPLKKKILSLPQSFLLSIPPNLSFPFLIFFKALFGFLLLFGRPLLFLFLFLLLLLFLHSPKSSASYIPSFLNLFLYLLISSFNLLFSPSPPFCGYHLLSQWEQYIRHVQH